MRRLYVFGTGHAMVTKLYNTCFGLEDGGEFFLLDAGGGNGILTAMEAMSVPVEALRHLFLSHTHTDHILGGVWVVRAVGHAIRAGTYRGTFTVWGHRALICAFRQICGAVLASNITALLDGPIRLEAVEDGQSAQTSFGRAEFFDTGCAQVRQFGCSIVSPGGARLTYLGDEPIRPACAPYARRCGCLISEALCLDSERDIHRPYDSFHSTVKDACLAAQALEAETLVLCHTEDTHGSRRKALYTAEGGQYFSGALLVPDDREIIPIQ